jgi:hypothetical protein
MQRQGQRQAERTRKSYRRSASQNKTGMEEKIDTLGLALLAISLC